MSLSFKPARRPPGKPRCPPHLRYPIVDLKSNLKGKEVELTLKWDVMPTVGFLKPGRSHSVTKLTLPDNYV